MMDDYNIHNLFQRDLKGFLKLDPHLSKLTNLPYIYEPGLEKEIPILSPGIYILTGGRQIGKSTLLKKIMATLLTKHKTLPHRIYYLPCDTLEHFKQLLFEIEQFQLTLKPQEPFFLFIDEVTYVREWDRAIKFLADTGFFEQGSTLITGSNSLILKEAMMRFPGRRGHENKQDFHLAPLSFSEYITLRNKKLGFDLTPTKQPFQKNWKLPQVDQNLSLQLHDYFNTYLLTGGFMAAINDLAKNKSIAPAIYQTYIQWIIGDFLKRGKQESYLKEIITGLIPRLGKQITWHNLASVLSIEHHQTAADYAHLLEAMDVIVIQPALREDKLQGAPKKAKKVSFKDPFIFHALYGWSRNQKEYYELSIQTLEDKSGLKQALIEGVLISLFKRIWETYYIKAEGEVDIALIKEKTFFPIEVKASVSLHSKDLKQILKYQKGLIAYGGNEIRSYQHLKMLPIPLLAFLAT